MDTGVRVYTYTLLCTKKCDFYGNSIIGAKVRIRIRIEELSLISAKDIQYDWTRYVTHKYFLKKPSTHNIVHSSEKISYVNLTRREILGNFVHKFLSGNSII
jgi:hypothetical protein